jgi:hypothetical protein
MTEEIQGVPQVEACGCEPGGTCPHQDELQTQKPSLMDTLKAHRGNNEMALAILLALTPLAVLTFFGQVGLI